jgi:hypothetical protein
MLSSRDNAESTRDEHRISASARGGFPAPPRCDRKFSLTMLGWVGDRSRTVLLDSENSPTDRGAFVLSGI